MSSCRPELLLPAHGLPIAGQARIARVLDEVASALEDLVHAVLDTMNAGSTLDEIIHSVTVPEQTLARPYLRPNYDAGGRSAHAGRLLSSGPTWPKGMWPKGMSFARDTNELKTSGEP